MYGPPLGVKQKNSRLAEVVCKNVSGLLVERTPGHDEDFARLRLLVIYEPSTCGSVVPQALGVTHGVPRGVLSGI
jgi:hypothetical protein